MQWKLAVTGVDMKLHPSLQSLDFVKERLLTSFCRCFLFVEDPGRFNYKYCFLSLSPLKKKKSWKCPLCLFPATERPDYLYNKQLIFIQRLLCARHKFLPQKCYSDIHAFHFFTSSCPSCEKLIMVTPTVTDKTLRLRQAIMCPGSHTGSKWQSDFMTQTQPWHHMAFLSRSTNSLLCVLIQLNQLRL